MQNCSPWNLDNPCHSDSLAAEPPSPCTLIFAGFYQHSHDRNQQTAATPLEEFQESKTFFGIFYTFLMELFNQQTETDPFW